MKRIFGRLTGYLQDHPIIVSALAILLVGAHILFVLTELIGNTWEPLTISSDKGIAIYLGAASAASIVAGFAGVVVVFGLTASGDRFRQLRIQGSRSLARNWTSASVSGFTAAGISLGAAVLAGIGMEVVSPWLFEWSMLLLLHGTIRIIWLLRSLMKVVQAEDFSADRESSKTETQPGYFT